MIGVVWVLPRYVDETTVPLVEPPSEQISPVEAPSEAETLLAKQKRKAERALGEFLQRQAMLEAQEVATWGGEEYEQVLFTLAAADAAFANGNFEPANTKYTTASAMLSELESSKPQRLKAALSSGDAALEDHDGEQARHHYQIALALDPQNKRAAAGIKRAATVAQLVAWMAQARALEQDGDWQTALDVYEQAVNLDPQSIEAREGLERVNAEIEEQRFRELMSTALAATKTGRFDLAREALSGAQKLRPDSSDIRGAEERLRRAEQEHQIAANRQRATTLAAAERWREAANAYSAVLAIDPQAQFAVHGLEQSRRLAELHDQLDQYILQPGRLQSDQPRANAKILLALLQAMEGKGPRLLQKQNQLDAALQLAETPVQVQLRSDEMTDVRIDRVGDLGRFKESTVSLLPGTYTVRGSRTGYRDVRLSLIVQPGTVATPLVVRCEEQI